MSGAGDIASPTLRSPRRRWLWATLIVSLAVNALFVGITFRTLWHVRNANFTSIGSVDHRLPGFVSSLPEARRAHLRGTGVFERRTELLPLRRDLRQARAEAVRIFTADPFDRQAFQAADQRLSEAEDKLRRAIRQILTEIGQQLTLSERKALLRWMRPGSGRSRAGRWRHDRDPAGDQRSPP